MTNVLVPAKVRTWFHSNASLEDKLRQLSAEGEDLDKVLISLASIHPLSRANPIRSLDIIPEVKTSICSLDEPSAINPCRMSSLRLFEEIHAQALQSTLEEVMQSRRYRRVSEPTEQSAPRMSQRRTRSQTWPERRPPISLVIDGFIRRTSAARSPAPSPKPPSPTGPGRGRSQTWPRRRQTTISKIVLIDEDQERLTLVIADPDAPTPKRTISELLRAQFDQTNAEFQLPSRKRPVTRKRSETWPRAEHTIAG